MQLQRLFLQEPLIARLAYVIQLLHVFFHMVMHGILTGLDRATVRTDEVALLVLKILDGHSRGFFLS